MTAHSRFQPTIGHIAMTLFGITISWESFASLESQRLVENWWCIQLFMAGVVAREIWLVIPRFEQAFRGLALALIDTMLFIVSLVILWYPLSLLDSLRLSLQRFMPAMLSIFVVFYLSMLLKWIKVFIQRK